MTEPLIYTTKGNVPVSSLTYATEWTITPEYIKLREFYTDAAGEVVRDSSHVYSMQGVAGESAVGGIG